MAKSRILFVDDEPRILEGLRRMLHKQRSRWDMQFISEPREALRVATETPFDVVISDMRMPAMTGAELLAELRAHAPSTVRIILSGQAEMSSILKAIDPSHRFLSKPCDGAVLEQTVSSAIALRSRVGNPALVALVGGVEKPPTLPSIYAELQEAIESGGSIQRIAEIIARDIGMTAKLLKLMNSSYLGERRAVDSVIGAVELIGIEALHLLVLEAKIFEPYTSDDAGSRQELQRIVLDASNAAERACKLCKLTGMGPEATRQSVLAAFLREIGVLLLAQHAPDLFGKALEQRASSPAPRAWTEHAAMGTTDGLTGAYLLGLWGFTSELVEAVAFHNRPSQATSRTLSPLTIVHIVDGIERVRNVSTHGDVDCGELFDMSYLREVGVGDRVSGWLDALL